MPRDEPITLHVIFHGQVQGVFFRAYTKQYAEELGLTGTVQNLADGTVEAHVQGSPQEINQLLEKLQSATGPGHVTHLDRTTHTSTRRFSSFEILP